MGAAVDALEEDGVDEGADVGDGFADFDLEAIAEDGGVFFDASDAGGDVGAAAFEGGDDGGSGDVVLVSGVVEDLGEGGDVGGVEPDDAEADIACDGEGDGEEERE